MLNTEQYIHNFGNILQTNRRNIIVCPTQTPNEKKHVLILKSGQAKMH
jgi:hypothetical protein